MSSPSVAGMLDLWIPEKLRKQSNFHLQIRAKILLALYFATFISVVVMVAFLLLVIPSSNANWMHGIIASGLAILFLTFQLWIYYQIANVYISGIIFSMTFFLLTLLGVVVTSGWHSPLMMLFFCSPVISFLVGGRREGLYITSLVFFCGAALMVLHNAGFELLQIVAVDNMEAVRFSIWITSTGLLVACLTTYDFLLEHAIQFKHLDRRT